MTNLKGLVSRSSSDILVIADGFEELKNACSQLFDHLEKGCRQAEAEGRRSETGIAFKLLSPSLNVLPPLHTNYIIFFKATMYPTHVLRMQPTRQLMQPVPVSWI